MKSLYTYQDKNNSKYNMAKNERYKEIYLKKINGYLYVLLPRAILNSIFATNNTLNNRDQYVLSFSNLNNIGDWYETIGHLYFYKLKEKDPNVKDITVKKSLCPLHSQFLTYSNISTYAKSYPAILKYTPSLVAKFFNNIYTNKLFNLMCNNKKTVFKNNRRQNSYIKLS